MAPADTPEAASDDAPTSTRAARKPRRPREVTSDATAPSAADDATAPAAVAPIEVVAPAVADPAPRPRRRRRILALTLGGVGLLVIAGLAVAYGLLSARYAPTASVSSFLDQVVKGRSTEAVELMSPKPEGNPGLTSDDVYQAAKHRVTSYRVESTTVSGGHAHVKALLHTDAGSWSQTFTLVTHHRVLLWDIWTVDGSDLQHITLDDTRPAGVTITANDVPIQKDNSDYNSYYALPGSYTFAIESDNSLVAADSHAASIHSMSGGRNVKVQLRFRLTDDGIAAGRTAVDQFLDGCLAQASLAPTGNCGFYVENDPTGTISSIQWSITKRPVVSFGDWEDNGWTVKTDTAGVFEMDGIYRGSKGYGDVAALFTSYDVQGYLDLNDGKIVFHSTYSDGADGSSGA